MREITIAKIDDLENGQMKQIAVGDSQLLLSKIDNKFYTTGAFCTHYGTSLEKGILCGEKIICPWHNACFNAISGQQEEPPGLDSLASFPTEVVGDNVRVTVPEEIPQQRILAMAKFRPQVDNRTFVILGAGAAGSKAVETLRQKGFQGRIIFISAEQKLPYDRTKLSKNYLQGHMKEDSLPLRSCEFYDRNEIELKFGTAVTKVDTSGKSLTFEDGSSLNYDSLLLATGVSARKLDVPGADLENIFTIRQTEDVESILTVVKNGQKALVVGSSFIAMEAAASLTQQGLEVTVVSPSDFLLKDILGEQLGKILQKLHEKNGVTFKLETKAIEFIGDNKVEQVILENSEKITVDLAIVCIGFEVNTNYLEGIHLQQQDNSIRVNKYLQTEVKNVYAAGDIAYFPYPLLEEFIRIEHWRLAAQQGKIAAQNMLHQTNGGDSRLVTTVNDIIPFFWSRQYDLKLRYVGHAKQWDEIYIDGDLDEPKFLVFYLQEQKIMAVAGVNRDREITAISELMRQQKMPDAQLLKEQSIDWISKM